MYFQENDFTFLLTLGVRPFNMSNFISEPTTFLALGLKFPRFLFHHERTFFLNIQHTWVQRKRCQHDFQINNNTVSVVNTPFWSRLCGKLLDSRINFRTYLNSFFIQNVPGKKTSKLFMLHQVLISFLNLTATYSKTN